ncbi:MAG: FG-GAP-like repeat-containing protein [Melioribacteraceae bacterium]|nr:MAG: FG-GAP-like repeat-containing protein [Melioribacteraceae bacterium]
MKNKFIILFLFLTSVIFSQSSNYVREINPFEVSHKHGLFNNIFSGGLNNPEFQFVDIDADDDYDLFILSSEGSFVFFENTGNKFNPVFTLSEKIPIGLAVYDWFFFVDIDNDSDYDFFTGQRGSKVKYFENNGSKFSSNFELKIDTVRNFLGQDLNVESGSNPAFVDIDNDGDFDLICGNTSGTANFYKNIGSPEEFVFDSLDGEWQNLRVGLGKMQNQNRHGSSSIEFVDIENNETLDLFWGDLFNSSLYFIRNTGTPNEPQMVIESSSYPINSDSISTEGFNMPRFIDIDHDGDLDLFSSVLWNDPSIKRSISFRKNNGGNQFEFITDNYLNLLDVGSRSIPELIDIDNDGDLDLFIGSEDIFDGSIYFLENTGTANDPSFVLVDSNYFGINSELSLSPTFGDLDNDGDFDLLVGNTFNDILYLENTGTKVNPNFENRGVLKNQNNQNINGGVYIRPRLFDVDNDGDLDLIIGNFKGEVLLYRNIGSPANYSFQLDESYFDLGKPGNYTNPFLYDYDNDGINELFVGIDSGYIFLYENDNNITPNFVLIDNNFLNKNFGREPNIMFGDLDNDGDDDLIIGNMKGWLYFYRNSIVSSVQRDQLKNQLNISIKSYPNPFNSSIQIEVSIPNNIYFSLKIFNILGEEVSLLYQGTSTGETNKFVWNTNKSSLGLSSSVYIVSVQTESKIENHPVLFLK